MTKDSMQLVHIWKLMNKHQEFMQTFANFGLFGNVTEETRHELERFVCMLYGGKKRTKINEMRSFLFRQKFSKGKSIDLMLLPPCQDNLYLHIDRSCYVANIFCESSRLKMLLDSPSSHGWDDKGNPVWSQTCFPEDVCDLLLVDETTDEELNESDYELSDSDEDNDCDEI